MPPGYYHGHGTLKFSLYFNADLRIIEQEDLWDGYEGYSRYGKMDVAGKLTYKHVHIAGATPVQTLFPPAVSAFEDVAQNSKPSVLTRISRRRAEYTSMLNLKMSTVAISATTCLMELACTSLCRHPGTGRSVFYTAIWESGRWVGAEPKFIS